MVELSLSTERGREGGREDGRKGGMRKGGKRKGGRRKKWGEKERRDRGGAMNSRLKTKTIILYTFF